MALLPQWQKMRNFYLATADFVPETISECQTHTRTIHTFSVKRLQGVSWCNTTRLQSNPSLSCWSPDCLCTENHVVSDGDLQT